LCIEIYFKIYAIKTTARQTVRRENVLLQVFIVDIGLRVKEVQLLPVFVFKYKKPQQIPQNYQQLYRSAYYVN